MVVTRKARRQDRLTESSALLSSTLHLYRRRIVRNRRRGFLGTAFLMVGTVWIVAALLFYLDLAQPYLLPVGLELSVALPLAALMLAQATRPSPAQVARTLDARTDNQQRIVTAVELAGQGGAEPMAGTQVETTAGYLARFNPKLLVPVRPVWPQLSLSVGLLCVALALFVLKGAFGFTPYAAGALPGTPDEASAIVSPTAQSGLPGSDLTPTPNAMADKPSSLDTPPGQQGETGDGKQVGTAGDAGDSQSAQSSLQKLGDSLNGLSAAQSAVDNLRKGNYDQAAKDLADLGTQSDQLSDAAKKDLADALQKAAAQTGANDQLRNKEQAAANALRKGEYKDVAEKLGDLGDAVKDTAGNVMSQQELARTFPSPTAQPAPSSPQQNGDQAQNEQNGQNGGKDSAAKDGEQGKQGDQSKQGDQGKQAGKQGQSGQEGQSGKQGEQGDQSGQPGQGEQGGQDQGGQNSDGQSVNPATGGGLDQGGEGQSGMPGEGHRESGPTGPANVSGGAQNPFELEGQTPQQPTRPSEGGQPAVSFEGSGTSSGPAPVAPGSAGTLPGENSRLPVERWGIVQRYFNGQNGK